MNFHVWHEWQPGPMLSRGDKAATPIFVVLVCRCGAVWPRPILLEDRIQEARKDASVENGGTSFPAEDTEVTR